MQTVLPDLPPLPRILAGPILRRVTVDSANVWLATSRECHLELRILDGNGTLISKPPAPRFTQAPLPAANWQLGAQLWFTLLTALPLSDVGAFPSDALLHYEIIDQDTQEPLDLGDVCLQGASHPSFFIPSQLGVIAYGSCRKTHGLAFNDDGTLQHKDSLALLTDQLEDTQHDLNQRPAMLFLVGDQIYADDVLPELMTYLQALAVQLMGKNIPLPDGNDVCSINTPALIASFKKDCGLTSNSQHAHVLSFGEYAALYLVTFGNRVGFHYSVPRQHLTHFSNDDIDDIERLSLQTFLESQPQARKAFANTVTYMNFDDHDITDDWNLNRSWYDKLSGSANGTRVIANGLAAYWAFQGWGNNPDNYSDRFIHIIKDHLDDPDDAHKCTEFDFHLWKFRRWSFVLPTTPPIFVMDSRTQRDFGRNNQPPQLLDRYALDAMRGEWLNIANQAQTPIFITGTPVFGFSSIEWLQDFLYRIGVVLGGFTGLFSASSMDVESWVANRRGFAFFLDTLLMRMKLNNVTFLSGDVHYSFANRADYSNRSNLHEPQSDTNNWRYSPTLQCLQLTSSAMRNTPQSGRWLETFLANWIVKVRLGACSPETLPWWERVFFWRFFRYNTWIAEVKGIPGQPDARQPFKPWWKIFLLWRVVKIKNWRATLHLDLNWITSRPNVALVYLQNGEVVKQVLLSGDARENNLTYAIPKFPENTNNHPNTPPHR
jgi:hypothetical protein